MPVIFSSGEQPHYSKFSAIGIQAKAGLALLEKAIGDIWNQSGEHLINNTSWTDNALMIPNLARYIGATKYTSPRLPNLSVEKYYFSFDEYAGKHEAQMDFPVLGTTFKLSKNGGSSWTSVTPKASLSDVEASGEWYVDSNSGWVYFFDAIGSNWMIEYQPSITSELGEDAQFNIIPDPNTDTSYGFQSLKIEYVNGADSTQGYYIYLPPHGPLTQGRVFTHRHPQDNILAPRHDKNFATSPETDNIHYFQSDSADAAVINGRFYRYSIPTFIKDEISANAQISPGTMYLWDPTGTRTILEEVTITADGLTPSSDWRLIASGSGLDNYMASKTGLDKYSVLNLKSSSQAASMYPSGGLKLITVGTSVSESISTLWDYVMNHSHNGSNSLDKLVSHGSLTNNFDPNDYSSIKFATATGPNDWHPQYLHRAGLVASSRDKYQNGMLGDLFMTSVESSNNHDNLSNDSRAIRFASSGLGPKLSYSNGNDTLTLENKDFLLRDDGSDSLGIIFGPWVLPPRLYYDDSKSALVLQYKDLMLGAAFSNPNDSLGVSFGLGTNPPRLYYSNGEDSLILQNTDFLLANTGNDSHKLTFGVGGFNFGPPKLFYNGDVSSLALENSDFYLSNILTDDTDDSFGVSFGLTNFPYSPRLYYDNGEDSLILQNTDLRLGDDGLDSLGISFGYKDGGFSRPRLYYDDGDGALTLENTDLVLANALIGNDSLGIVFGTPYSGKPRLYYDNGDNALTLENTNLRIQSNGIDVVSGDISVQGEIETSGDISITGSTNKFTQGQQEHWIWVGLNTSGHNNIEKQGVGYTALSAGVDAYFEIDDWPEDMELKGLYVNWKASTASKSRLYFYKYTWDPTTNSPPVQSALNNDATPAINYVEIAANGPHQQTLFEFDPAENYSFSHYSDKIVLWWVPRHNDDSTGAEIYAVSFHVSYTSVNKWTP